MFDGKNKKFHQRGEVIKKKKNCYLLNMHKNNFNYIKNNRKMFCCGQRIAHNLQQNFAWGLAANYSHRAVYISLETNCFPHVNRPFNHLSYLYD